MQFVPLEQFPPGAVIQPTAPYILMAMAQRRQSMKHLIAERMERLAGDAADTAALMDLALIWQLYGERDHALAYQNHALGQCRLFLDPAPKETALRLLCLMAPGDLTINQPVELLVHGRDITLIKLYLAPGETFPETIPEHDAVLVAVSEYDHTRPILEYLSGALDGWPRPVINRPQGILKPGRDEAARLLEDAPGLAVPGTVRWSAEDVSRVVDGGLLADDAFPLIVRPVGTHAGKGMVKVDDRAGLAAYRDQVVAGGWYNIAPFVDYRAADGHYRKYRVAVIDGRPFVCHVAISDKWMVHYGSSGMEQTPWKRDEEARRMEVFDLDFVPRHRAAFDAMTERLGLDYIVLDCAETADGLLLYFEADNAGAVHDLDPPDLFPYKLPQMRRIFDAFESLVVKIAGTGGTQ